MAQKYYARWPFHILTMAQSPGMVDSSVIEDNIARMILMSREEIDAKEAQEMLNAMGGKEWSDLMNVASDYQYSPEVQDYLTLHNIERHRLYPITEVLKDESEAELSEEEAEERMWDLLDEFNWETIEEAAESVSEIVGHDVAPTVEAIEEALNDYEEEHEDEDVFYSFHEFEIA